MHGDCLRQSRKNKRPLHHISGSDSHRLSAVPQDILAFHRILSLFAETLVLRQAGMPLDAKEAAQAMMLCCELVRLIFRPMEVWSRCGRLDPDVLLRVLTAYLELSHRVHPRRAKPKEHWALHLPGPQHSLCARMCSVCVWVVGFVLLPHTFACMHSLCFFPLEF